MIHYQRGHFTLYYLLGVKGSVVPRTLLWAIPNVVATCMAYLLVQETDWRPKMDISLVYHGYNTILGFLIIFRTQQAYSRWWEGGTLLQQARGEWFNAFSSTLAFCSQKEEMHDKVKDFQMTLVRLMSMLYCASLEQISQMASAAFEVVDADCMDEESRKYLMETEDRVEVVLQWVQRHIVEGMNSGILNVAPPILSRVFQELGRGVVNINNVRKITEFLYPYPIVQMTTHLLLVHWLITPIILAVSLDKLYWCAACSFISVSALWSVNFIATEIEQPFGDDANDLPMHEMQQFMNRTLLTLLEERSQIVPTFDNSKRKGKRVRTIPFNMVVKVTSRRTRISQINRTKPFHEENESDDDSAEDTSDTPMAEPRAGQAAQRPEWPQRPAEEPRERPAERPSERPSEMPLEAQSARRAVAVVIRDAPEVVHYVQSAPPQLSVPSPSGHPLSLKAGLAATGQPRQPEPPEEKGSASPRTGPTAPAAAEQGPQDQLDSVRARLEEVQAALECSMQELHRHIVEELSLLSAVGASLSPGLSRACGASQGPSRGRGGFGPHIGPHISNTGKIREPRDIPMENCGSPCLRV